MSNKVVLKRGDSDKNGIWAGNKLTTEPGYNVKNLQTDLKAIGVYSDTIDGGFGVNTERSLKIYQWCLQNSINIIKNKALTTYTPKPEQKISGVYDTSTEISLKTWLSKNYIVTGDLVRISLPILSNIELSPAFKHIGKPIVTSDQLVVSKAAAGMIKLMNTTAKSLKIKIMINQALRIHGVKVTGSVVAPATKSQHLIGHAIDCNIVDGKSWNSSSDFKKKKQTANADKFIKQMKNKLFRWGGNFSNIDTPHFDKKLSATLFSYDAKFFLNQKQISSGHPIEKFLITK